MGRTQTNFSHRRLLLAYPLCVSCIRIRIDSSPSVSYRLFVQMYPALLILIAGLTAVSSCKPNCSDIRVVVRSVEHTGEYNRILERDLWRGTVAELVQFVVKEHEFRCEYAHGIWCGRDHASYDSESGAQFMVPHNRILFKLHQLRASFEWYGKPVTVGQEDGPMLECLPKRERCVIRNGIQQCVPKLPAEKC